MPGGEKREKYSAERSGQLGSGVEIIMATLLPKVLVQVSVTGNDILKYKHSLIESFSNLRMCDTATVYFLVVYQSESGGDDQVSELMEEDVETIHSSVFSASRARNMGIDYAVENDFDFILFHDASLVFSPHFLTLARASMSLGKNVIARGKVTWKEEGLFRTDNDKGQKLYFRRFFRVMPYPYIWLYVFPVKDLESTRFNEEIGPGKNVFPNCGEDVMFLLDYFSAQPKKGLLIDHDALVFHPPRNSDKSKQLEYARGQGRLYRMLLRRKSLPCHIYFSFLFFVINSVRYAVFFGEAGREIFKKRWQGFWQEQASTASDT